MVIDLTIFPVLITDRLILRRLTMDDAPEIRTLRSDESVNEFVDRPKSITMDEAGQFIQKIEKVIDNNEGVYWAIALKETNRLIGTICYWNISHEKEMAEIGFELHPSFQGKGLMQEALSAALKYGFDTMKLKVILALTVGGNKKSIRILVKNNFCEDVKNEFVGKDEADGLSVYYLSKPG